MNKPSITKTSYAHSRGCRLTLRISQPVLASQLADLYCQFSLLHFFGFLLLLVSFRNTVLYTAYTA